jgi:hypothetical protein
MVTVTGLRFVCECDRCGSRLVGASSDSAVEVERVVCRFSRWVRRDSEGGLLCPGCAASTEAEAA